MLPRVHKNGHSFRGIAKYLLHDADRAKSSDRVAWVETRNLATRNPDAAWRVMAATAMNAERLKDDAGVKRTGNKPGGSVMHVTISWRDDEVKDLTRDRMLASADAVLAELGREATDAAPSQYAKEHQAMIVCHTDKKHPHVHIIVNRVHPEHGRMLVSSHSHRRLRDFAKQFEIENGKIVCPKRLKNEKSRQNGERYKGSKNLPRNQYEAEKERQGRPGFEAIRKEQRQLDRQLRQKSEQTRSRHENLLAGLESGYRRRQQAIKQRSVAKAREAAAQVERDFEPRMKNLLARQRRELASFGKRQHNLLGRVQNTLSTLNWRSMLSRNGLRSTVQRAFDAARDIDPQLTRMQQAQERAKMRLKSQQKKARQKATKAINAAAKQQLASLREQYLTKHQELTEQVRNDRNQLREAWRTRNRERREAWQERLAVRDFQAAARHTPDRDRDDDARRPTRRVRPRVRPDRDRDDDTGRTR